jgi:hypothetical protein
VPGGAGAQPAKTTGPAATAPAVSTAVPTAQIDGPVAGTLCKQCNKKERYREGGKTHPYCGKTCAEEAIGRKIGQTKPDAKLSNNAMIEEEDSAWRGSDYMAMAGITHVEMMQQAHSLGFVAVAGTDHVEDEGSMYSPGMVELLQSMGFNSMHAFSESEPSEIGDEPRAPEDFSEIEEEAPIDVPEIGKVEGYKVQVEDFSEIEEAAPSDVPEIGKVEGLEVQLDLPDDNWMRVSPQFNRRERGVAKEEMKAPWLVALGAGYYSVLDNAEAHDGYHDKLPAALSPVLEMVQEVHDVFSFDYIHEEILMHFEKQRKLWPVFQTWKYHAGIRPTRDDGKSLLKWLKWRSRKRKKFKKKLKLDDLYHHWFQTEVQDVNLYMSDSEVDAYNDAQYGLQTEDQ